MTDIAPVLNVRFFCTDAGNEPVREWLTDLPREHRRLIGTDIKTVQLGWPIGMPVVRKLDTGLWEVRIDLGDTIARVLPSSAKQDYEVQHMNKHIGSDFDDFLAEQGLAEEVSAAALKRVIAWQIAELMKAQHVTKKALADRMHTSRTAVDRALDQNDAGMTLATLASAARALGQRVEVRLIPEREEAHA
jgi:hypothetical protein